MTNPRHSNRKTTAPRKFRKPGAPRGRAHSILPKSMPPLLLAAALFLTGCTPEEKTMLLPQASSAQSQEESRADAADYTVKKIYTYSYDTLTGLGKSAFLSGCGENEIHILSLNGQEPESTLECRRIDYRYGFYDVTGNFPEIRERWSSTSAGEAQPDLYLDRLLPSPDGTQLLVYVRSAFWDGLTIWLYTMGSADPLLLYEGTADGGAALAGSFSPDGRWVTFDAGGACTGPSPLIPVYDCRQTTSRETAYWWIEDTASRVLVPDQVLFEADLEQEGQDADCWLWDARLLSDSGGPRLLSLVREGDHLLGLTESPAVPDLEIRPDASLLAKDAAPTQRPAGAMWHLSGYERTPYPLHRYSCDGAYVYYLSNPATLLRTDLTGLRGEERILDFPDQIWDFLPLPSGDILAALIQETESGFDQNTDDEFTMEQYIREVGIPVNLQEYLGILSGDLYLYPQGASQGLLLYKNLRNLLGMEYDEETKRILLETYEGSDRAHRRCIVLEL